MNNTHTEKCTSRNSQVIEYLCLTSTWSKNHCIAPAPKNPLSLLQVALPKETITQMLCFCLSFCSFMNGIRRSSKLMRTYGTAIFHTHTHTHLANVTAMQTRIVHFAITSVPQLFDIIPSYLKFLRNFCALSFQSCSKIVQTEFPCQKFPNSVF